MSDSEPQTGFGVVIFDSTQRAIGAERCLIAAGLRYKLIAVPRHLSRDCGFAVRFAYEDRDALERALGEGPLGAWAIYPL